MDFGTNFGTEIRVFADIKFNMDACLGALDCGQCLLSCPAHVLRCYVKGPEGHAQVSTDWIPTATFPSVCTGCMKCVEHCPKAAEGAIVVDLKPTRLPAKWYKRR